MRKKIGFSFILLFTLSASAKPTDVRITSLNIAWYGNTKFHTKEPVKRDKVLKKFLGDDLQSTDIFLFQEITKPEKFEKILDSRFRCASYNFRGGAHQYVLTCFDTNKFQVLGSSDELFDPARVIAISAPRDRLRDVLSVSLKELSSGQIINTYNLHLKAGYKESARRKVQTDLLIESLVNLGVPLNETQIVGGDFNSYIRNIDGERFSEIDDFLDLSEKNGLNFFTVKDLPTTLSKTQKIFDFLMIKTKKVILDYFVHPICDRNKNTLKKINFYKTNISDHCAVTAQIEF